MWVPENVWRTRRVWGPERCVGPKSVRHKIRAFFPLPLQCSHVLSFFRGLQWNRGCVVKARWEGGEEGVYHPRERKRREGRGCSAT